MVKYLQMDGVDDYLQLSRITLTKIEIDMVITQAGDGKNHYFVDPRIGSDSWAFMNQYGNYVTQGFTLYENGIPAGSQPTLNIRKTFSFTGSSKTDDVNIFSRYTNNEFLKADVYLIKIYNGNTLVAHYDMSTGTVLDQSGNGNHATLNGGTWLDDGTGGGTEPVGVDGFTIFSLSQKIYSDEILSSSTKQSIYSDEVFTNLTSQTIYQDDSISHNSKQNIYSDGTVNIDSKQIIYEDSFVPFATLQEIFNDGQMGSIDYPLLLQIYSDEIANLSTLQSLFDSGLYQFSVSQTIYENNQIQNSTKQIIYSDSFNHYDLSQKIYSDNVSDYSTKQSIYETNSFTLNTLQQLFEHSSMDLQTKQSIYQLDTVEILTLQSIYEDNSISIDTLQQFLSDYVEYIQVFKYLLGINRQSKFDLGIVGNQKFGVDISDRVIKYDLSVSDQVKKYDLNI